MGWDGTLYDCDFNLALNLPANPADPAKIGDVQPNDLTSRRLVLGDHCFGCTAGFGSSCGGALVDDEVETPKEAAAGGM